MMQSLLADRFELVIHYGNSATSCVRAGFGQTRKDRAAAPAISGRFTVRSPDPDRHELSAGTETAGCWRISGDLWRVRRNASERARSCPYWRTKCNHTDHRRPIPWIGKWRRSPRCGSDRKPHRKALNSGLSGRPNSMAQLPPGSTFQPDPVRTDVLGGAEGTTRAQAAGANGPGRCPRHRPCGGAFAEIDDNGSGPCRVS